jgi:hypothetical protein
MVRTNSWAGRECAEFLTVLQNNGVFACCAVKKKTLGRYKNCEKPANRFMLHIQTEKTRSFP